MSIPSPQEFGESLGLKPGMDVGPSRVLRDDEMDSHMAVVRDFRLPDLSDQAVLTALLPPSQANRLASAHSAGKDLSPFWVS
jgi:hypothetical protein